MATKRKNTLRAPNHDYSEPGAYFFTTCLQIRRPFLSKVVDDRIECSWAGNIVHDVWRRLPELYSHLTLDCFVVMPDHLHGILVLNAEADFSFVPYSRPSVSDIVRALKPKSAIQINRELDATGTPLWERGFHDHVIRPNDHDLARIRDYIVNNPLALLLENGIWRP